MFLEDWQSRLAPGEDGFSEFDDLSVPRRERPLGGVPVPNTSQELVALLDRPGVLDGGAGVSGRSEESRASRNSLRSAGAPLTTLMSSGKNVTTRAPAPPAAKLVREGAGTPSTVMRFFCPGA